MNREILLIMLLKEVKNASRNRSLILFILFVPLIIFPIIVLVPPILANPPLNPSPVLVVNLDNGAQGANLTRQISQTQGLVVVIGDANSTPQASVQSGLYDAALVIPQNFTTVIANNQTATLQLYYDTTYSRSTIAVGLLNAALLYYSQQIVLLRNTGRATLVPIGISPTPLVGVRPLIAEVGNIFPTLCVGWAVLAGAYLAIDMVRTEKDESVLTSLLSSPFTRFEIMAGKTVSIVALTLFVAILTIIGVYVIPTFGILIGSGLRDLTVSGSIPLTASLLGSLALGVALSFLVSALLLQFIGLFLTGAGRAKITLAGVLGSAASAVFLLSTNKLNFGFGTSLLPFLGPYTLLTRVVAGIATVADVGLVTLGGVMFGFFFVFLAYREFSGDGLLLHTAFARVRERAEEEASTEQDESPKSLSEESVARTDRLS